MCESGLDLYRWLLRTAWGTFVLITFPVLVVSTLSGQPPQCDPGKVLTADSCAKCHGQEVSVWRRTAHFKTFEQLHRDPRARQIALNMDQRSIKRGNVCIGCHYTTQQQGDKNRVVSGISCESCHGAALDWLDLHQDYGGPTAAKTTESKTHKQQRLNNSIAAGMRNPVNLYLVAQSCMHCHTVPNESLVNTGTHVSGSDQFELVSWSQGTLRHNFLRTNGSTNAANPVEKLRVMFVVGQIADLEYSTRATALATERARYGLAVANRAATVAVRLYEIQQLLNDPLLEKILRKFSEAELKINNQAQLVDIADAIKAWGIEFAVQADGRDMVVIDSMLPGKAHYR